MLFGVIVPPKGYLQKLREICTKHGILLIFDEVICGFGRMGTPFGADFFATWGKLAENTPKFIIESDASIVTPLLFAYVLGW